MVASTVVVASKYPLSEIDRKHIRKSLKSAAFEKGPKDQFTGWAISEDADGEYPDYYGTENYSAADAVIDYLERTACWENGTVDGNPVFVFEASQTFPRLPAKKIMAALLKQAKSIWDEAESPFDRDLQPEEEHKLADAVNLGIKSFMLQQGLSMSTFKLNTRQSVACVDRSFRKTDLADASYSTLLDKSISLARKELVGMGVEDPSARELLIEIARMVRSPLAEVMADTPEMKTKLRSLLTK